MPARPLVTFAVFAYNQADIVAHAVRGALAQTYTPLQIILSDDCSRDDTFAVMQALANDPERTDPHAVILNRNPRNLGIGAHVNRIMELAEGELIVPAAGDDISEHHRTATVVDAWLAGGKQSRSLHSALVEIDAAGNVLGRRGYPHPEWLTDPRQVVRGGVGVLGATHAWAREVFDRFGPLMPNLVNEDIAIPFRSFLMGPITYIDEPLVRYRVNSSTWHPGTTPTDDVEALRKRLAFHLRLAHLNAIQAHIDALKHDDPHVLAVTRTRLQESWLMWQLSERKRVSLSDVIGTFVAGADIAKVAGGSLRYHNRLFHETYKVLERLRS